MEIKEFPLTCHQISAISIKKESSDYVVLPSHLKPKRSNILGYYIFRITSDISDRWIYCRVIDWTKEEHDCYLPTWMMNYLGIPNNCEAKFTYEEFAIPKAESVVLQPTDEVFASYSSLVELNNIRSALRTYTMLTNNSHILLNVDGQAFTVIVRLLKPAERCRVTNHMKLVVANTIYRKTTPKAATDANQDVSPREEVTDLLSGLCSHCYRSLAECHCKEMANQTDLSHSSRKQEEEANRRIALAALAEYYCMNCFEPKQSCHCPSRQQSFSQTLPAEAETEPNETALQFAETAPNETCVLREEDYNIMQLVERELAAAVEQKRRERQQEQETEQSIEPSTEQTEETKSEEEAQPMEIPFVESDDQGIYYYWPILPEELCQRWDVDKATRIPPPPPEVSEKDDKRRLAKKNTSIWAIFKRRD
ncbi:hypothetical protein WA588_005336 [Blastocystis sp. NMH]